MNDYYLAYTILKDEYERVFRDMNAKEMFCPDKTATTLTEHDGVPTVVKYDMIGLTLHGTMLSKSIVVNDDEHKSTEKFTVSNNGYSVTWINKNITAFRCGIMTSVIISEMRKKYHVNTDTVGFAGTGNINIHNAKAIAAIFGTKHFVIRGSRKNRGKNYNCFRAICDDVMIDDTDDFSLLNECDIVVSGTSGSDVTDMLSADKLSKPRLMIALDTGWLFDESFRKSCDSFADYAEQLEHHYKDEFIFDSGKYKLHNIFDEFNDTLDRACVYVYGIGFADAVIGELLLENYIHVENF